MWLWLRRSQQPPAKLVIDDRPAYLPTAELAGPPAGEAAVSPVAPSLGLSGPQGTETSDGLGAPSLFVSTASAQLEPSMTTVEPGLRVHTDASTQWPRAWYRRLYDAGRYGEGCTRARWGHVGTRVAQGLAAGAVRRRAGGCAAGGGWRGGRGSAS